jgi:hypothetical protein
MAPGVVVEPHVGAAGPSLTHSSLASCTAGSGRGGLQSGGPAGGELRRTERGAARARHAGKGQEPSGKGRGKCRWEIAEWSGQLNSWACPRPGAKVGRQRTADGKRMDTDDPGSARSKQKPHRRSQRKQRPDQAGRRRVRGTQVWRKSQAARVRGQDESLNDETLLSLRSPVKTSWPWFSSFPSVQPVSQRT